MTGEGGREALDAHAAAAVYARPGGLDSWLAANESGPAAANEVSLEAEATPEADIVGGGSTRLEYCHEHQGPVLVENAACFASITFSLGMEKPW